MNMGRGAQTSATYYNETVPMLNSVHPGIEFIQQTTPNDDTSDQNAPWDMQQVAQTLGKLVDAYGGLPIYAVDYQRQLYGATIESSTAQAYRLAAETMLLLSNLSGTYMVDLPALCYDQVNGQLWLNPGGTIDGIHWADACHLQAGISVAAMLKNYLRY
jgi:hypothetical protein